MTDERLPESPHVLVEYDVRSYQFFWGIVIPFSLVAVVVAGGLILVITTRRIGPFLPLLLFPIIVAVMLAGAWGTEAYRLALRSDGQLEWRAIRRAGSTPLQDIRSIHSSYPPWLNIVTIEAVGEEKVIRVPVLRGFREFVDALQSKNPEIHLRLDWGARLAERLPWPSGLRRRDVKR